MRYALALTVVLAACAARAEEDLAAEAEKAWTLEAGAAPATVKAGEQGKIHLDIVPARADAKVHPDAPLKAQCTTADASVKLAKDKLGRADSTPTVKKGARIELAFSGEKPGKAEIACALDFYICTEKWCVRQKRDAKVPVTVQ